MRQNMDKVAITDVTLREYGQNVPSRFLHVFTPQIRIEIAQRLISIGFEAVEVFSCVHPRLAPAMSEDLVRTIAEGIGRARPCHLITLVPNLAGYKRFLDFRLGPEGYSHSLGVFFSAVEAHNLLNLGRPIQETLDEYKGIARDAASRGIRLVAYVSAAFGYRETETGKLIRVEAKPIAEYLDLLFDLGAAAVTLSDLQGVADQEYTRRFLEAILKIRKGKDVEKIGYHPHHVSGDQAIANSMAAYAIGIRRFDASLGGTGGCVTGAPGNQPTEGLVELFEKTGVRTGVDLGEVAKISRFVEQELYSKIRPTRET
jgi:hydroxymethylglutaryl-CoA lyase